MFTHLPQKIRIVEVGPRDGLQNEKNIVPTEDKIHYIELLMEAGFTTIEATSFVRKDRIPQMGDAVEVMRALRDKKQTENQMAKEQETSLVALVPNLLGLEEALSVGVKEIAVFTSTSDTFNQKNINTDIRGSLEKIRPVINQALKSGVKVRGYISTVFGCPYEGNTSLEKLVEVSHALEQMGVYEISYGDTIGVASPRQVVQVIELLEKYFPTEMLAMHFHDTKKIAVANVLAALECGITIFDASSGGLGGCPYAKGSSGNIATEDLLYLMESMGIQTGVDSQKLKEATSFILEKLGKGDPLKEGCLWRCC